MSQRIPSPPPRRYTVQDLLALPYVEGERHELIGGRLFVSTSPSLKHQFALLELAAALRNWDRQTGLGRTYVNPGLVFSDDDSVEPDVVWVSHACYPQIARDDDRFYGAPDLVVEVLSPGLVNRTRDRHEKFGLYDRQGVPEYWLVDWEERQVDIARRLDQRLLVVVARRNGDVLTSPQLPGFTLPVTALWHP